MSSPTNETKVFDALVWIEDDLRERGYKTTLVDFLRWLIGNKDAIAFELGSVLNLIPGKIDKLEEELLKIWLDTEAEFAAEAKMESEVDDE